MLDKALSLIRKHEGLSVMPYRCPAGKLTIGYGHNLEATPISKAVAEQMLLEDVLRTEAGLGIALSGVWGSLNDVRKAAIVCMAYNLGLAGLMSFKKMRAALYAHDFRTAAAEALDSKWAQQVGKRAEALARMIEDGEW